MYGGRTYTKSDYVDENVNRLNSGRSIYSQIGLDLSAPSVAVEVQVFEAHSGLGNTTASVSQGPYGLFGLSYSPKRFPDKVSNHVAAVYCSGPTMDTHEIAFT